MAKSEYWYSNAIIYAIDLETYRDSNGDGIGDFNGIIEKLDYLSDLGINCIWLLPFFRSPEMDNGYDVEDYFSINPKFGTYDDFIRFRDECTKRHIHIIMDLIINHTSSNHPWFKAASYNKNSKYFSFYIWKPEPPADQKESVFTGPTWTYCVTNGEYYYHKYYDFEPELNLKNPAVFATIKEIIGYWIESGISGFRVDAATNLFEEFKEEGKDIPGKMMEELNDFLTSKKEDAFFIAEADVKAEEINDYVTGGNRMTMMFNFLLNNSIFLAITRKSASPIIDRLKSLPDLPLNVYWVNFIRNLDELDLDQLTAEEREEVFNALAPEKRMQVYNRGIRRRVAPLLMGNVRQLKMIYNLLFALPGIPAIMYGDEIGMGDNLVYDERIAVRTPMQWNASLNGGFSEALPEKISVKPISEGAFSHKFINAEASLNDPDSVLSSIRKFIRVRKSLPWIPGSKPNIMKTGIEEVFGLNYNNDLIILVNLSPKSFVLKDIFNAGGFTPFPEDSNYDENSDKLNGSGYRWFRKNVP